eukprot:UN02548
MKSYFGRKIAIDASMCLYQFLIAVRQGGEQLAAEDGEVTSHLQGMFYRTLRLLDNGIKPVFVFDGKPPELKFNVELQKRAERREKAEEELKVAQEAGDQDEMDKLNKRLVKVNRGQNLEVQRLLTLMGIPWIEAASEAEALCAELAKRDIVYATATEDMDALTFGTPRLIRNLLAAESRNLPVIEITLDKVLQGMGFTYEQFVDYCILLGCDYTVSIPKVGPAKAFEMITDHGNIADAIPHLPTERYTVPKEFHYKEAAKLFIEPEVGDVDNIKFDWKLPDQEGLIQFLCGEKGFQEERVRSGIKRMLDSRKHMTQQRLENFFKPKEKTATAPTPKKETPAKKTSAFVVKKKASEAATALLEDDDEDPFLAVRGTTTTTKQEDGEEETAPVKKVVINPAKLAAERRKAEEEAKKAEEKKAAAEKRRIEAAAKRKETVKRKAAEQADKPNTKKKKQIKLLHLMIVKMIGK